MIVGAPCLQWVSASEGSYCDLRRKVRGSTVTQVLVGPFLVPVYCKIGWWLSERKHWLRRGQQM